MTGENLVWDARIARSDKVHVSRVDKQRNRRFLHSILDLMEAYDKDRLFRSKE